MTLLLVHTAHPQAVNHSGEGFGRLLSPRQFSRVFLWLALGSLSLFWTQTAVKFLVVLPALALVAAYRVRERRVAVTA